jgi:hypothetical protein
MVPIKIYIYREKGIRIYYAVLMMCLFFALLAFSGCSETSEDDVTYISVQELIDINNSLIDYMFLKRYFDEPDRIWAFLQEIAVLHYDLYPFVASNGTLWTVRQNDISSWLQAKEKSEDVFRELCSSPKIVFDGNEWNVIFNVFKKDGSVDKWNVKGEYYPIKKYNQITKIEITALKPKGTFSCPMIGNNIMKKSK